MKKIKSILLYLIGAYLAYQFIYHGYLKFDPDGFWPSAFIKKWGYGMYFMFFIGFIEFFGGIALLIPRLARYGGLALAIVMLGALATRIIFGTSLDDVLSISFNMVILLYISIVYGIETDIKRVLKQG